MGHFLLTGAFSGLGLALGEELGSRGMKVAGMGRSLGSRDPATLSNFSTVHEMDFATPSPTELDKLISQILATYPEIQLIINAAQIEPLGPMGSLSSIEVAESINVNIASPILIINSFLKFSKHHNKIFVIGSGAANYQITGWDLYSIGKSALLKSIDFISKTRPGVAYWVEPGVIDTAMQAKLRSSNWGIKIDRLATPKEAAVAVANQILNVDLSTERQ
jgi:NAD(P)-dependent dehydrogenase (short-subunit alcohol dehydrogenase family)